MRGPIPLALILAVGWGPLEASAQQTSPAQGAPEAPAAPAPTAPEAPAPKQPKGSVPKQPRGQTPAPAPAQPAPPAEAAPSEPVPAEAEAPEAGAAEGEEAAQAEPGEATVEAPATAADATEPPAEEPATATPPPEAEPPSLAPGDIPSPGELGDRLDAQLPEDIVATDPWTAPVPVLTLHGYLRARGELMDTFWLGRREFETFRQSELPEGVSSSVRVGQGPDPFSRFRPVERRTDPTLGVAPTGLSCVDEDRERDGTCSVDTLQFANMRLRLSPQLNLSEDVRVKMTFDVFDNFVMGQEPVSYYGTNLADRPDAETTVFASTQGTSGGLGDTIVARRAWAEVRNRDLGELRFGRMPQHWGLGMYYNAGDQLDDDYSTETDRVMGITKLAGLYFTFGYDFVAEGFLDPTVEDRPNIDQSQLDDVDQFTFSVARRHTPEDLAAELERGDAILDGGFQLAIRNQDSLFYPADSNNPLQLTDRTPLTKVEAVQYTMDLWALFRWRGIRLETELAWNVGSMDDVTDGSGTYDISQFGYALESEFRFLDDKLALYFYHGLATGDADVEGLSADADYISQFGGDDTISTFRFHPAYRVDMILWRNIMRQVTGAFYFKPGISYDFVKGAFGQLFGARLDVVYSRATSFVQTWGNDPDLGIEINAGLYWRSEDGPELEDGYHAALQYGVLFPMRGLGYYHEDTNLDTAQTVRLLLGVVY